ncbi:MAG: M24 family metallopeptidase [Phycisphaerales bacterium]
MVLTKPHDKSSAHEAATRVVEVHQRIVEFVRAGQTLPEIDGFIARVLDDLDCRSAFLRYKIRGHPPFPSHACISVNDCVVHGTHVSRRGPLEPGDVVSIDIGVSHRGWVGDAGWTYAIEHQTDVAQRMMKCGKEALAVGIAALTAGSRLEVWAQTVEPFVEDDYGFYLVEGLGGHGYGRKLHGPPYVSNVMPVHRSDWVDADVVLAPGQLLAVELMMTEHSREIISEGRDWPIYTVDGGLAVHYESDVMIDEAGPINLTAGMFDLPDIVGL